jgi:uncharacterized delta-60 repeat protein
MSLIPLGFWAASGGGVSYWIATLGGTGSDYGNSIAIDSENNSYVLGYTDSTGAGSNDFLLAKYDSEGTIQWQRVLGGTGDDQGLSISTDSSNNVYVTGFTNVGLFFIAKYNPAGTIQWQRVLGSSSENSLSIAIDSSNNVYVTGYTSSTGAGGSDELIAKYNSSGTIQWQRTLGGTNTDQARSIKTDSSNNIYILGRTRSTGAGSYDFLIAKYNSSGTIQWQRTFGGASTEDGRSIKIDSSNNIYVFGDTYSTGAGGSDVLLAKYDSSGIIQWQRTFGGVNNEFGYSVGADSSNNIYIVGSTESEGEGSLDILIAKYDSSGTIQWQRTMGGLSSDYANSVAVDLGDNLYIFGTTNSAGAGMSDSLIAKIPNNGGLTGTYILNGVNIVYSASSLTSSTSSLTSSTSSLTDASSSLIGTIPALSSSSAALTSHLVTL